MEKEKMTDETVAFLKEREERFGGEITWRGFSIFYADSSAVVRERGVFVFRIKDTMYFEDFEVTPKILGIPVAQKKKSEYVKLEGSFKISDIASIKVVKRSDALNYALGKTLNLKSASPLAKFFTEVVRCVEFKNGSVKFFEFAGSAFEKAIK